MSPAAIASAVQSAADHLFMPWLVILLLASGLYLTLRYRVVQVRRFGDALAAFIGREDAGASGVLSLSQVNKRLTDRQLNNRRHTGTPQPRRQSLRSSRWQSRGATGPIVELHEPIILSS